ncbi:Na+/H+ antiporter NhaA [Pseudomonas putida S11]|nr:Na+/H+ antiporter NhaA [Pseudomonas putida S11]
MAERAFANLERFLHIEAVSGIVLLVAAIAALIWANSPAAESYDALWHTPLTIGVGSLIYSQSLHFWINDGLMTIFFLVVGMEIRREIHEGALSSLRQAMLPMAAAIGGVAVPALFYLGFGHAAAEQQGWAVPTATDIAFAVGVLALLGKSIPSNVRVFLLALAIIDDIIAVLIIAFFYSGGLDYSGFGVALIGLLMVIGLQKIGVGSAYAYIIPGFVTWLGILLTGAHPTLAGVVLGLMTPVTAMPMRERPLDAISRFTGELLGRARAPERDASDLMDPLKRLRLAQRELVPPVVRMQGTLHPWVAFGIMPVFALANAGVKSFGCRFVSRGPAVGDDRRRCRSGSWQTLGHRQRQLADGPLRLVRASRRGELAQHHLGRAAGRHRFHHVDLHCQSRLRRSWRAGGGETWRAFGIGDCSIAWPGLGCIQHPKKHLP